MGDSFSQEGIGTANPSAADAIGSVELQRAREAFKTVPEATVGARGGGQTQNRGIQDNRVSRIKDDHSHLDVDAELSLSSPTPASSPPHPPWLSSTEQISVSVAAATLATTPGATTPLPATSFAPTTTLSSPRLRGSATQVSRGDRGAEVIGDESVSVAVATRVANAVFPELLAMMKTQGALMVRMQSEDGGNGIINNLGCDYFGFRPLLCLF